MSSCRHISFYLVWEKEDKTDQMSEQEVGWGNFLGEEVGSGTGSHYYILVDIRDQVDPLLDDTPDMKQLVGYVSGWVVGWDKILGEDIGSGTDRLEDSQLIFYVYTFILYYFIYLCLAFLHLMNECINWYIYLFNFKHFSKYYWFILMISFKWWIYPHLTVFILVHTWPFFL